MNGITASWHPASILKQVSFTPFRLTLPNGATLPVTKSLVLHSLPLPFPPLPLAGLEQGSRVVVSGQVVENTGQLLVCVKKLEAWAWV